MCGTNNTILNVSLCAKVFKTLRFYMHGHEFTDHYYDCINFTGTIPIAIFSESFKLTSGLPLQMLNGRGMELNCHKFWTLGCVTLWLNTFFLEFHSFSKSLEFSDWFYIFLLRKKYPKKYPFIIHQPKFRKFDEIIRMLDKLNKPDLSLLKFIHWW